MSPALHVVTGKGGVGKSTVAAALALAQAMRGRRVLAIELGEAGGLCRVLGAAPAGPGAIARGAGGVSVAYFDGAAALGEYLIRRMHLGRLGRAVIAHPLYRAFVAAAPGVRELLAMGKVRDELILQRRWDVVVLDAGASGHALEHLRMPSAAARAFGAGLLHREAAVNAALLRDGAVCRVHVVALAEEMPLREGAQVVAALRGLGVRVGAVIVNQCRPAAPAGVDDAIARLGDGALAAVARRARGWERIQERGIAALEADAGVTATRLPRLWIADGLAQARALAPALGDVP